MPAPWPLLRSQAVFDAGLFSVSRDRARSPRTGGEHDFHVVHMADWLMVVPLTADGRLVLVRQYRHGSRAISLELPGGLHDHGGERARSRLTENRPASKTGCDRSSGQGAGITPLPFRLTSRPTSRRPARTGGRTRRPRHARTPACTGAGRLRG
ncbi:MAG TPA: hypothetical protein VF229_03240, partial [Burkholderiaceae bacterium]